MSDEDSYQYQLLGSQKIGTINQFFTNIPIARAGLPKREDCLTCDALSAANTAETIVNHTVWAGRVMTAFLNDPEIWNDLFLLFKVLNCRY